MSWQASGVVIDVAGLEPSAKLLLLILANYAGPEGESVWPSQTTMARQTGLSRSTVAVHLSSLRDRGLLVAADSTPGEPVHYQINLDECLRQHETNCSCHACRVSGNRTGGVRPSDRGCPVIGQGVSGNRTQSSNNQPENQPSNQPPAFSPDKEDFSNGGTPSFSEEKKNTRPFRPQPKPPKREPKSKQRFAGRQRTPRESAPVTPDWFAEFEAVREATAGGPTQKHKIGAAVESLDAVRAKLGHDEALRRWRYFCESTDASMLSAPWFQSSLNRWKVPEEIPPGKLFA